MSPFSFRIKIFKEYLDACDEKREIEVITPAELQEKKLKITVSDLTLILYFNILYFHILIFMYSGRAPKGELCNNVCMHVCMYVCMYL